MLLAASGPAASLGLNPDGSCNLAYLQVDTVIICGAMTNTSVETTARSAFTQNFNVIVCSDGSAASDTNMHEHSLKNLRYGFADVLTCGVVRGRFQTPWLSERLETRRLQLSVELPSREWSGSHQWGARSDSSSGSRRAVSARLPRDQSAGAAGEDNGDDIRRRPTPGDDAAVAQEDEGWWLKERRADIRRAQVEAESRQGEGNKPGGPSGGGSIFAKIAAASRKADRLKSAPATRTRWVPPTRRARELAEQSGASTENDVDCGTADGQASGAAHRGNESIGNGRGEAVESSQSDVGSDREAEAPAAPRRAQGPAVFMFSKNVTPSQRLGLRELTTGSDEPPPVASNKSADAQPRGTKPATVPPPAAKPRETRAQVGSTERNDGSVRALATDVPSTAAGSLGQPGERRGSRSRPQSGIEPRGWPFPAEASPSEEGAIPTPAAADNGAPSLATNEKATEAARRDDSRRASDRTASVVSEQAAVAPAGTEAATPIATRNKMLGKLKRPVRQLHTNKADTATDGSPAATSSARPSPPATSTSLPPQPPKLAGGAAAVSVGSIEESTAEPTAPRPPAMPPPAGAALGPHSVKAEGKKRPARKLQPSSTGGPQHPSSATSPGTTAAAS